MTDPRFKASQDDVVRWQEALRDSERARERLLELRGFTATAMEDLGLGLDLEDAERPLVYPIRDATGALVGVVKHQPDPERVVKGRPKIKAVSGSVRELFPAVETIPSDGWTVLVEGETKAPAARSIGLQAVGAPGLAKWEATWSHRFAGRSVAVIPDFSPGGRIWARERGFDLAPHADKVVIVDLEPSHNEDERDFGNLVAECQTDKARRELRVRVLRLAEEATPIEPLDGRVFTVRASDVTRRRVRWLWPGRIPIGSFSIVFGQGGLGKGLLQCMVATKTTRGEYGKPGAVVIASAEDAIPEVLRPRLEAAGADLDLVHFLGFKIDGLDLSVVLPDHLRQIEDVIYENSARLLLIDPLVAHLGDEINSWRDQDVRKAIAPLQGLAERRSCACVGVVHTNRRSTNDPMERISGSGGLGNAARSVLYFDRDPDDPNEERGTQRVLAHTKTNLGEPAATLTLNIVPILLPAEGDHEEARTARIEVVGTSPYSAHDLLARAKEDKKADREPTKRETAQELICDYLELGACSAKALEEHVTAAGVSQSTFQRERSNLQKRGLIAADRIGNEWIWRRSS